MNDRQQEQKVLARLVEWAGKEPAIRAMILYSSRANPKATVDRFSDYDILLAVTDIHPFYEDDCWLDEFGQPLVVFRNPIKIEHGFESFGFITHYQDGTKIDYAFFPAEFLRWAAGQTRLPDDLDNGYKTLLDKDRLADGLKSPTYAAYLPSQPTEREYRALIDEFFNDAAYVAKNIWREDLFSMKYCLDYIMKFTCLRKMLEWQVGIDQNWLVKPGAYGKCLKKWVDPGTWAELERTYVGAGPQENWESLFRLIDLFHAAAVDVGSRLNFDYPHDQDQRMLAYLRMVQNLPK